MCYIRLSDCYGVNVILATDKELTNGDVERVRSIAVDVKLPSGEMREDEWQFDELVDEIVEKCKTDLDIEFGIVAPDYDLEI